MRTVKDVYDDAAKLMEVKEKIIADFEVVKAMEDGKEKVERSREITKKLEDILFQMIELWTEKQTILERQTMLN